MRGGCAAVGVSGLAGFGLTGLTLTLDTSSTPASTETKALQARVHITHRGKVGECVGRTALLLPLLLSPFSSFWFFFASSFRPSLSALFSLFRTMTTR